MTAPTTPQGIRTTPGFRVLFEPCFWAVIATLAMVAAIGFTALIWRPDLLIPTSATGDPWNYLAAAERLRAGHPMYEIGPGDRTVAGYPGMYSLPLLAPPMVAVLWMPLLLLGPDVAMIAWAVGGFVATISTVVWMIVRGGIGVRILVAVLAYPIATTALSGNVNAYLVPILVASWLGVIPGRGALGGAATGFATVTRVGPAIIGLLYVVRRRVLAAGSAAGVVVAICVLSLAIAGPDAWVTYIRASLNGAIEPTNLSVPGMLLALGASEQIARLGVAAVWVIAGTAIVLLRDRPRSAFVVAVVAAVFATPVVRIESWALFLGAAAPWMIGTDQKG